MTVVYLFDSQMALSINMLEFRIARPIYALQFVIGKVNYLHKKYYLQGKLKVLGSSYVSRFLSHMTLQFTKYSSDINKTGAIFLFSINRSTC